MSEQKRFKAFRSELNESEYKETLTGYPNRGIDTDVGAVKHDADTLQKINGVLAALGRYTYQHTAEAMIKIRTRLNLFMIDFPWTPWMWQSNPTGTFTLNATLFGRVDGVDGMSGNIRFDGKASPNAGMNEFALVVTVEPAEDGFYRVNAKLQPQIAVVPEGVEHEGDSLDEGKGQEALAQQVVKQGKKLKKLKSAMKEEAELDEMAQTPARQRDMEHAIQRAEDKASRGYSAKMTKTGKAGERGRKQEAKYDAVSSRLIARDTKEYDSPKLYGRGGKVVKGKRKPVKEEAELDEMAQTAAREQQWSGQLRKIEKQLSKDSTPSLRRKHEKLFLKGMGERHSKKLYGKNGKPVKEEAEPIEEMLKAGDKVKVPHKGKMVRGRIVRHDSGGSGKAQQHGGGYVVDVGEYGSITVPTHKVVKEAAEQIDELSKATKDAYVAKRGSQLSSMLSGHTRGKQLTGKQQANAVKGIKQAMGVKEEVVDEALIGGQKKLDVNKNKRLDAQDFKMLRSKKKPVEEALIGGQKKLDVNKNKKLDSQDFAMLRAKKKPMKEYTETMGGIPLTAPDPTAARADKSGKGKRFHKGAIKSVEEAVAKGKKAKKPSPHQGAANVIGKQKAIKSRLEKNDMRW